MGVLLFYREKNRISVNENGKFFYPLAKKLLEDAEDAKAKMKAFDENRRSICISSCLPFPLIPLFNEAVKKAFPSRTIQKKLCPSADLLPIDGYWNELIKEKVKDARFLSQKNAGDYTDIMNSSFLISFSTDLVEKNAPKLKNKKLLPPCR